MDRIAEIQARLAAINTEIDGATGEALTALENESRSLLEELQGLQNDAQARQQLRQQIAAGAGTPVSTPAPAQPTAEERAADQFRNTNRMTIPGAEARALLISSGKLVKPDKTSTDIQDMPGAKVSSIVDLIHIEDCEGMSSYTVPYVDEDAAAAGDHVEGQAGTMSELAKFNYKTINPSDVIVLGQISKQAKKQTNVKYAEKVRRGAHLALRKKAVSLVTAALKASDLVKEIPFTGKIDASTLRNLVLQFGDDESAFGPAYLALNKKDLLAFGDVRGTNEKKAIYEITPDDANPNFGTIKEGGLTVRYVLLSGLTALSTAETGAGRTMFYGDFNKIHAAMFSDYEVKVSEDFAFDKLMDTIRGDLEMGVDVVAKHGLLTLKV